jgi:hypothetical protein
MSSRIIFLLTLVLTSLFGCNPSGDNKKVINNVNEDLYGDWEMIIENENSTTLHPYPSIFYSHDGMTITKDSIEFYLGFYKNEIDSIFSYKTRKYLGNFVPYKKVNDSIIIKNPITNNWEFKWRFLSRINDTLHLSINDSSIIRYKKLNYNFDSLPEFDQIIYSNSGCYGSCPIIDISVSKDGSVLLHGVGYVKKLGFFSGKLDAKTKNFIFNKFRRANPLKLDDNYSIGHTDDQTITTTYIQNGKIVKTIHDYGKAGTSDLYWAYVPISNIQSLIKLDSLSYDDPFFPKLHYFTFKMDSLILPLEKSESFYLWTELKKSKIAEDNFIPKYNLTFTGNYTYWNPDPFDAWQDKYEIKSITTDGQFFKFEFTNKEATTYDLGYNFIDRNFKLSDFKKPNDW